jgi:hypothetical protein
VKLHSFPLLFVFPTALRIHADLVFQERHAVAREEVNVLIDRLKFDLLLGAMCDGFHGWI